MTEVKRLRPVMSASQMRRVYSDLHDHTKWPDHLLRVNTTIELARWLAGPVGCAADLSCGDGTILRSVDAKERIFGDFVQHNDYKLHGPIEQTIDQIPKVDLFICTETLEHLNEPDKVLAAIREKTRLLVLSTPVDAWRDTNPEHYWAWSREGVEGLLQAARFTVVTYNCLDFTPLGKKYYKFGTWGCK